MSGSRLSRVLRRIAVVGLSVTFVPVGLLYAFQDRFVFAPEHNVPPIAQVLPAGVEVRYATSDDELLTGWYLAADEPGASVALVFHGQGGTRADSAPLALDLHERGMSVFLAEYRGFAESAGSPSEEGLVIDAVAAWDHVTEQLGVPSGRVLVVGFSLGTGVAVRLAERRDVPAMALLSPYTSLPDVAWDRLPLLPYRLLMRTQFDSQERLGALDVPVLLVGGTEDQIVPPSGAAALARVAGGPTRLVEPAGADHFLMGAERATVADEVVAWADEWLA